ncbi:MAG: hypothetical protein AAF317_10460, partial [Pseudomonadota bacterium]
VLPMGCGTIGLFGSYDVRESADVADAEWSRLVDVPQAPEVGAYSDSVPDPAIGIALGADVGQITSEADAKAQRLAAPVLTDEDRAAMGLE